jgi:hypothetical protein
MENRVPRGSLGQADGAPLQEPPQIAQSALPAAAICLGMPVPKPFHISSVKLNAMIPQGYGLCRTARVLRGKNFRTTQAFHP